MDPRSVAGLLLLCAYAVPLFAPPDATPVSSAQGTDLLARLFPGIPGWWVAARLASLAAGAVLLSKPAVSLPRLDGPQAALASPRVRVAALAVALALVTGSLFADRLARAGQVAIVLGIAIPPLLLYLGERRESDRAAMPRGAVAATWICAALIAAWVAARFGAAWHAPRTAVPVDLWESFGWLLDAARDDRNLLLSSGQPGISNAHMILLGFGGGLEPSLAAVEIAHAAWLCAAAAGVAALAHRFVTPSALPVAVATFLFSPFLLLMPHSPSPFGIYLALAAVMALALARFTATNSLAALTALGSAAGLASTTAYGLPWVGFAGVTAACLLLWRRPRPVWIFWALPGLCFLVVALPSLPDADGFRALVDRYVVQRGAWATLEAILLGQRSPFDPAVQDVWSTGQRGLLDVPLGSLLSPFAAPRTALRLWADAIFDPLGTSLAAIGIAVCVRRLRTDVAARVLLAGLAAAIVPGTLWSAYDRASLTRNLALPIPIGLLAGVGFEALRSRFFGSSRAAVAGVATAVAIAASGVLLFDVVNPRVLPASALSIQLEALGDAREPRDAVQLVYGRPDPVAWLYAERIARHLPRVPLPSRRYVGSQSLYDEQGRVPELLLWTPALEHDESIARTLCERWPDASIYVLADRAARSVAFAARVRGPDWVPSLPQTRVRVAGCAELAR